MLTAELKQKTLELVEVLCPGRSASHGVPHMNRVAELAHQLAVEESASEYVQYLSWVAGAVHDVADLKYCRDDEHRKRVLFDLDCGLCEILPDLNDSAAVLRIIGEIGFAREQRLRAVCREEGALVVMRAALAESQDEWLARNCVSDADKLEAIGETGINRCKSYKRELNPRATDIDIIREVVRHGEEKLFILVAKGYFRTRAGQARATQEHRHMMQLVFTELRNLNMPTEVDRLAQYALV